MGFYLVVDEQLNNIQDYSMGEYYFSNQKQFNQTVMNNWRKTSRKYNEVAEFIKVYRDTNKDKMVIEFTDREADNIMFSGFGSFEHGEIQKRFDKIKGIVDIRKCIINSLIYHTDIALRRVVIYDYFRQHIVPKISKAVIDLNDRHRSANSFHFKNTGWGYIAAYKHKVVMEFVDRSCYWIRLIHTPESVELVEQNLTKNKNTRIFLGGPKEMIRYIDIFTDDENSAHLLDIICNDSIKGLNINITPMIHQLKEHDLFYAVQGWKNQSDELNDIIMP